MSTYAARYKEDFPDTLCVKHKITPFTEKKTFHLHSQLEILFTVSDNLICRHEKSEFSLPQYSFVLLNTMCLHYIGSVPGSGCCNRYVITFSPEYIDDLNTSGINLLNCFLSPKGECVILTPPSEQVPNILMLLDALTDWTAKRSIPTAVLNGQEQVENLSAKFQFGVLLTIITKLYLEDKQQNHSHRFQRYSALVFDICQYIEKNIDQEISVDELAKHYMISKTMLYNITHEVLQVSLSDYISMVRINKAKSYLNNTEYSIELISEKVGYSNISSFSRFFKSNVGMSPLKYRKLHS